MFCPLIRMTKLFSAVSFLSSCSWNLLAGFCLAASVFLLAVVVSWISRNLPSAFNEKDQVFQAASISVILVCVVAALEALADEPTSSPNIQVSRRCFHSLSF
jgi:hypothetical protein